MNRAQNTTSEIDIIVMLADEIGHLNIDCGPTRDILDRLHAEIVSMQRAALIADAQAVLIAASTKPVLQ